MRIAFEAIILTFHFVMFFDREVKRLTFASYSNLTFSLLKLKCLP